MNVQLLMISFLTFVVSTCIFRYASQGLGLTRLNIVSVSYYFFIIQSFFGIVLIAQGFDGHYTLNYLETPSTTLRTTFVCIHLVAIGWPTVMVFALKLFGVKQGDFNEFLSKAPQGLCSKMTYPLILSVSAVSVCLMFALFLKLGYVPLLKMLGTQDSTWLAQERIKSSSLYVGNSYLTNIGVHLLVPLMSYISFAYAVATREKKWIGLAVAMIIFALFVKTYGFAKSALAFHCMVYLIVVIYLKKDVKLKFVGAFVLIAGATILAGYIVVSGVSIGEMNFYNSPFSRLVFTQVGTLACNFDLFPAHFGFLEGRSASPSILRLFGEDPESHLRSARLLMEYYGSVHVYNGTAGVMNSLFIGEAYANHGWLGVLFSTVWIGFVLAGLFAVLIKTRKTPASAVFGAYTAVYVAYGTQTGFYDFIYSFAWITVIVITLGLSKISADSDAVFSLGESPEEASICEGVQKEVV